MNSLITATATIAPVIGLILFAMPSFISVLRQLGLFRGLLILLFLGIYAITIETIAIKTGVPYGQFSYDTVLGTKLFGTTPWVVAIGYPPILLAGFWLASKFTHSASRILLAGIFSVLLNVVVHPVMVKLEFWHWDEPGIFYGVPIINFAGWLVTASIGAWVLHGLWNQDRLVKRGIAYSGLIVVLFWSGANFGLGQWLPAFVGGVIGGLMLILAGLERWKTALEKPSY